MIVSILAAPKVKAAIQSLAKDAAAAGKQSLIRWLKPTAREKAAKKAIEIFSDEWSAEMEATAFEMAYEGYRDQFQKLIETTAAEIAEWMAPDTRTVDLTLIESVWSTLHLDPLPEEFSWARVAQTYARAINKYFKSDPELRAEFDIALQERTAEATERAAAATERIAGLDPGFDLDAYRKFLIENKCNALQLAALHTSTYDYDRKLVLWSIFVEPSARESAPVIDTPPEIVRLLRQEGRLPESLEKSDLDKNDLDEQRERYKSCPIRPIFGILDRERLVVVTGDPGSGKTSLLKYRALQWANGKEELPLPLLIDLKEYIRANLDLLQYCQSGREVFRLDASQLDKLLKSGEAAFYLDGLDEIFEAEKRSSVIEEIAVLSSKYPRARFVVTSRKIGYDPERLRTAGFLHATIEDFDQSQMLAFLRQWHPLAEANEKERELLQVRMERAITESQSIRELAGNPLLLTMMAILNRNQELPRNRVALYREASRVLLDDWDARKTLPVSEFDREDKEALLRDLAGDMQHAERGLAGNLIERSRLLLRFQTFLDEIRVSDNRNKARFLVKQLTERNFILAYAGAERFCFVHRTFLEYYCAAWFVERVQVKRQITFEQLRDEVYGVHWKDETWHEVLRLIAGMVSAEDGGKLIEFLMAQDGSRDKLANLMLAAGCLYEVRNRKAIQSVDEALWRRLIEEAIRFRSPRLSKDYEESSEVTSTRQSAVHWIALAWRESKARTWLMDSARNEKVWDVRRAAVQELARGWPNDPEILPWLKECARVAGNDESWLIRQLAAEELARGWPGDPETPPLLKDLARNDEDNDVRGTALELLARGWATDPEVLPMLREGALKDKHYSVRRTAVQELSRTWYQDPDIPLLFKELAQRDGNYHVRQTAVQELARRWPNSPDTLRWLFRRVQHDENYDVRQASLQELARGWHDNPGTFEWLKVCIKNDKDENVREAAVQELARGWPDHPETIPALKDRVEKDLDDDVRQTAVKELARGWPQVPEILQWLKERAFNDKNWAVRRAASRELGRGWPNDPEVVVLLQDEP